MRLSALILTSLAAGQLVAAAAVAGETLGHDAARLAVEKGEIRPLGEILAAVKSRMPGEVVAVELKRDHGRLVYQLKAVDATGRRHEFHVDAATAKVTTEEDDD